VAAVGVLSHKPWSRGTERSAALGEACRVAKMLALVGWVLLISIGDVYISGPTD
jgi:hypothetical protein